MLAAFACFAMIVRAPKDGGLLCIRQASHARMCARFADEWAWPIPRREETRRAVELHDEGWVEFDARPALDARGQPFTYRSAPSAEYVNVWRRGFERAWLEGEWVGLLVSLHGSGFLEGREGPLVKDTLVEQRALRASALEWLGHAGPGLPREVADAFRLLRFWDALSLFLCEEWSSPWIGEATGASGAAKVTVARRDAWTMTLDPWPFAGPEAGARVMGLHVPQSSYASADAFASALEDAEARSLGWTLSSESRGPSA